MCKKRKYFDIRELAYSRRNSYFSIVCKDEKLIIRDLHGGDESPSHIIEMDVEKDWRFQLGPTELVLESDSGKARFTIDKNDCLHIYTDNISLEFKAESGKYDTLTKLRNDVYEYSIYPMRRKFSFTLLRGEFSFQNNWSGMRSGDVDLSLASGSELLLKTYLSTYEEAEKISYEDIKDELENDWKGFYKSLLADISFEIYEKYKDSIDEAIYLLWVNFVGACGRLSKPAMYCSKNYMNNAWSWDYLFMCMALAEAQSEKAYEQIELFMEAQDASGCLPDYINDVFYSFSCVKPPVQGIFFPILYEENAYFLDVGRMKETYAHLKGIFDFWLGYRLSEKGLPIYYHGNDSGLDNSTVFSSEPPIYTPDLPAYLIRLADFLLELAKRLELEAGLDLASDIDLFETSSKKIFDSLLENNFDGKRFFSARALDESRVLEEESIINFLVLVLGDKLADKLGKEVLDGIVDDLKDFETDYGIATEKPSSKDYIPDGYWRGPIWAPTTYILVNSLERAGYADYAKSLKHKFFKLVEVGGLAENFNALTGEGYDDKGFAWTAAVFYQFIKEESRA